MNPLFDVFEFVYHCTRGELRIEFESSIPSAAQAVPFPLCAFDVLVKSELWRVSHFCPCGL